jgi:hypothetical protein
MSLKFRKVMVLAIVLTAAPHVLVGCAQVKKTSQPDQELHGMGMVIESRLAKNAAQKEGVEAISDAGNQLFMFPLLTSTGGETSSFGSGTQMSFPRWIHVTWRTGPVEMNYRNNGFIGGKIIGDYKIEVLSRIPKEVFKYVVAGRGRIIVLRFRVTDNGVLFAWDVEERVIHPSGGRGFVYSMHGGDFPCETNSRKHADCTTGRLEDAPWYNRLWARE